ncbi:MAG TPA: SGNH/GDSL hydrolase family protein, partial [Leptospiraceae bacterium]|nr:SGNH/GDSL hydrolase family protein [Leptospiraceae bacterium]
MLECNTKDFYDPAQTKITFYGDSRMDFVNSPGYGNSTMPSILNEPFGSAGAYSADSLFSEESIQNLGKEGYRSYEIVRHLDNCIPNMSKNYKIAKRFVFHVGGNNFMDSLAASWYAVNHLPKTAYGRSILPAVLAIYFEVTRFNLRRDLEYIIMNLAAISSKTKNGKPDVLVVGGYPARGRFLNVTLDQTPQIIPGVGNPFADEVKMTDPLAFYLSIGEYFTVGLNSMEADYSGLAAKYNAEYVRVWDEMNKPQEYMALDLIHPNAAGFKKWGSVVGKKLREISFNSAPKARSFTSTVGPTVNVSGSCPVSGTFSVTGTATTSSGTTTTNLSYVLNSCKETITFSTMTGSVA